MVITNAAYNNSKVKGLVYLAAFVPNDGQSLSDLVEASNIPNGFLVYDSGGFVYVNPEMFPQLCAQDIDITQAKIMAATQKPFSFRQFLLKNLVFLLGSNIQHGIRYLRMT
jgi:hypothetical protein